jgi:hypothetical protein
MIRALECFSGLTREKQHWHVIFDVSVAGSSSQLYNLFCKLSGIGRRGGKNVVAIIKNPPVSAQPLKTYISAAGEINPLHKHNN